MIGEDNEHDWQRRAMSEGTPRTGGDALAEPGVDRYRLVYRAIREAPLPDLSADFALQMERLTRDQEEPAREARADTWVVRLVFLATAGIASMSAMPVLARAWSLLGQREAEVPWPMLLAAVGSLVLVAIGERRPWRFS